MIRSLITHLSIPIVVDGRNMGVNTLRKQEYLEWYNVSREVLPSLVPSLKDEDVQQLVSLRDWLIFPLLTEVERKQAVNRPDPHIDITLRDSGKIRIGIRCNTVKSVEKLRNILDGYHRQEKTQLLEQLRALDDRFVTLVISKQKEYNFAQAPKHETLFHAKSNSLDEAKIREIFSLADEIRQRGIDTRKEEALSFPPEAPVIDIVVISLPLDEETYRSALAKIGPIFETCLSIKTRSELTQEKKRLAKQMAKVEFVGFICPRCQTKLPKQKDVGLIFCPTCGTRVKPLFEKRAPPLQTSER
ncbi:MAG: hypothetical protein ACETV1_06555 [Candidatus Bathyarchaeia archaeon]